jgi:apolipoprotein N-acyltransferase
MTDTPTPSVAPKKAKKPKPPPLPWRERWRRLALCTFAGVLVFLSFPLTTQPDSNIWPLAWVALVPLLEALRGLTGRQGFWFGAWCGLVTNFGGFWWISEVLRDFGHLPPYVYWPLTLLNSFYQGLMFALFGLLYARAARRVTPDAHGAPVCPPLWKTAALFTLVEWLFPMIFPWYLGNGQYRFLPAIQIAELGGVMSLTFVMVAFNAGLHRLLAWRLRGEALPRRALVTTFLGTALVLVYGQIRIAMVESQMAEAERIKLGLVEANIGIFEKEAKHLDNQQRALTLHRNLLKHQHMSAELAAAGVDLVVWPESSFFPLDDPFIKRRDEMVWALDASGQLQAATIDPADPEARRILWTKPTISISAALSSAIALASPREDVLGVLTPTGVTAQVGAETLISPLKSAAKPYALALVEAPGYAAHDDAAKLVAWVLTERGLATARLGSPLEDLPLTTLEPLTAIAMRTGREGVAVGRRGTLVEIEGGKARQSSEALTTEDLVAVAWGPERAAALAVGKAGTVLLKRDGHWSLEHARTDRDLSAVAFDERGAAWIAGAGGLVKARIGGTWFDLSLPEAADVASLAIDPLGEVFVATTAAVFHRSAYAEPDPVRVPWTRAPVSAIKTLVPAPWVETRAFPRDTRWVRQGLAPLPSLEAFDRDPAVDFTDILDRDRAAVQRGYSTPLLFGGLTWERVTGQRKNQRMYNTAMLLDQRGRVRGTYDKVYLLAFGEFMPFGDTYPELYKMFPHSGDFTAGSEVKVFDFRGHKIGVMICYEDIMVDFTGRLADLSPNVIINVTNDAWFGKTSEPWLHLALAVFRSVENRVSLVRSTNTGVSAFIAPTGRIEGATDLDSPETLIGEVPLMAGGTLYGATGNLFSMALLGLLIAESLIAWRRRRSTPTS